MKNTDQRSGTAVEGSAPGAAGVADMAALLASVQEQTRLLQRDARALRRALHEVDTAVAASRARIFRAGLERRAGGERRKQADPVGALVRWIDGEEMDRRAGPERRRAGPQVSATGSEPARGGNVVSLDAFRLQRARIKPLGR